MKQTLKKIARMGTRMLPLGLLKRMMPRPLVGFFYHAVSDEAMPHVGALYPPITSAQFEAALVYLKRYYTLVSYGQMHAHVVGGKPLPPNAAHITFDDGFAECYTVARPLLLKHEIPSTFFVTSDWIDNRAMFYRNKVALAIEAAGSMEVDARRMVFTAINHAFETRIQTQAAFEDWIKPLVREDEPKIDMVCKMLGIDTARFLAERQPYLTSAQIRTLHGEGFTIGSHTRSHPKLVQVDAVAREAEIVESSRAVKAITGQDIVPFSFPNSGTGLNRGELADIRARHPFLGLFFDTKGVTVDVPFIINRCWAEKPALAHRPGETTNLARVLRDAYLDAL